MGNTISNYCYECGTSLEYIRTQMEEEDSENYISDTDQDYCYECNTLLDIYVLRFSKKQQETVGKSFKEWRI